MQLVDAIGRIVVALPPAPVEVGEVLLHLAQFRYERVADRLGLAAQEQEPAEAAGVARLRLGAREHVGLLAKGALVAGPIGARPAAARLQMGELRLQAEAALRLRDAAGEKGEADDSGRNEKVETVQRP